MSEILLDRITLCADGSIEVVARFVGDGGAAAPSEASVRFGARDGAGNLVVPAVLRREGQDVWLMTSVIAPDALTEATGAGTIVDCFADVTIEGDVVSGRIAWDGATRWLPYPTLTRKLSLTRGAA